MKRPLALMAACLAACLLLLSACSSKQADAPAETAESDGSLTLSLADLKQEIQFFDAESDGTTMQVIALLDSDGTPHLAYNTCQVCAGSPYAYFELTGGYLICQNCGNAFTPTAVGRISGGCNPMPVPSYEVTDDSVIISAETLAAAAPMFKNWKAVQ